MFSCMGTPHRALAKARTSLHDVYEQYTTSEALPDAFETDQLDMIGRLFDEADADRSGTIDREEFVVLARELLSDTVEDADALFDQIDTDHSNDLTIEEVSVWFTNRMNGEDEADDSLASSAASSGSMRGPAGYSLGNQPSMVGRSTNMSMRSSRIEKGGGLPSKEGWVKKASDSIFGGDEQLFLVLNGTDEILRMYKTESIQLDDNEPADGAAEQAAPAETPVLTCSLHWEIVEIERGHDETALNLQYKNRSPSLVQLKFANAEELQGWWVAFSQIRDLSRRLVPSSDTRPETKTTGAFYFCAKEEEVEKTVDVGTVIGKSSVPGFDLVKDSKGNVSMRPHFWHVARVTYEKVLKLVLRPPRAMYNVGQLGQQSFYFHGFQYVREDFSFTNKRGMKVQCSMWDVLSASTGGAEENTAHKPCLVYLHGNASCRLEAMKQLSLALSLGASLVTLDTSGSGLSEGEYISLGHFEKSDVFELTTFLKDTGRATRIAVWGRSMGAVTALLYAGQLNPLVKCVIVDSPFASLNTLCHELVGRAIKVKDSEKGGFMGFVSEQAISMVNSSMQYRAKFSIEDVSPMEYMPTCQVPTFFLNGDTDKVIHPHHSADLFNAHPGEVPSRKQRKVVSGGHNDVRPFEAYNEIAYFLTTHLLGKSDISARFADIQSKISKFERVTEYVERVARSHDWGAAANGRRSVKEIQHAVGAFKLKLHEFTTNPWTMTPSLIEACISDYKLHEISERKPHDRKNDYPHRMIEAAEQIFVRMLHGDNTGDEFNSGMTDARNKASEETVAALMGH